MKSVTVTLPNKSFAGRVVYRFGGETQNAKILLHLIKMDHITQVEAHELYRVYRLASRINEIRKAGVLITTNMVKDLTGRFYARYSLSR